MTYGFIFKNNSGETVINDTNVKPWFWGQATVNGLIQDVTSTYSRVNDPDPAFPGYPMWMGLTNFAWLARSWTVYKIDYDVPTAFTSFIVHSLPSMNVFYSCSKPYYVANSGTGIVSILAFVPDNYAATVADIPKVYTFIVDPIPTQLKSSGYGVQLFKQDGQCTFDSGRRHFQPLSIQYVYIPNPNESNFTQYNIIPGQQSTLFGLDTYYNLAFLLPSVDIIKVGASWEPGNTGLVNTVVYNLSYPTLYNQVPRTYNLEVPAGTPAGIYNLGSAGLQPVVVVDGDIYNENVSVPSLPQSYTLSRNKAAIIEGETGVIISLDTTAVASGTLVPYTISGIDASDLTSGSLTGNFVVSNGKSSVTISAALDAYSEGTETATIALNNGRSSVNFTISDAVSYSLSSFMTPEEGQSISVTLTTSNLPNGSAVPYTITGITQADLTVGTISGNFTISSNTSALEFRFARDTATEQETMRISVNNGATFLDIPITDVPAGNEVLTINPSTITYNQRTTLTVTGGTPNGSFEFISTLQGEDPVYAWNNRWKPEYAPYVGTQYFDENGNFSNPPATALGPNGSDLGANPNAVSNRTFWIFTTTTKNFRSFNYTVNPEPEFFISGTDNTQGPLYVDEGTTGYFKVTTANIPNGTVVYPKLIGGTLSANDYTNTGANGITIQSNVATFQITFTADQVTDGATEYGELVVQYPNGTTKNSYGNIYVSDTSIPAASYAITKAVPSGTTADEGTAAYFYLTTNQTANLYWVLEGTGITNDDIENAGAYDADGNYYSYGPDRYGIINTTYYMLFIKFKNDVKTEGNENLTVNLKTGSQNGQVVASASVIIGDTSLYPGYGIATGDPYCIGVNRYQNYHDGNGGQYSSVIAYNSPICGYVPPASYSVSKNVATVNEDGYIIFTIGLTSVPSGTQLWWDISGTNITTNDILYVFHDAQDGNGWFTPSGGSPLNNTFTVYGQTSYQVIIYPRSDTSTENNETATFNLRTGYSGGPSQASTTFVINDTSTTPSYNESLTIVSDANGNYIVPLNGYMTISVTGGMPYGSFSFEGTNNGDPQPTTFTGTGLSLDGNGNFTNYITGATARGSQTVGDWRLWLKFNYNNNVRSARYQTVYDAGTLSGGQYCVGYTLTQNYNNGTGGTYSQVVEYNNVGTCNYTVQYTPARTRVTYNYYNFDFQGDSWGMDGGRPGGAVTATIVDGPYVGFALSGSFNSSGQYRQVVGNYGSLAVGFYTINFTFPGQDAYYSASYRTIVAYFYVQNASAGAGGVIP